MISLSDSCEESSPAFTKTKGVNYEKSNNLFLRLRMKVEEKAHMKTIKVMRAVKSAVGPFLPDKIIRSRIKLNQQADTNLSIPDERTSVKKVNQLNTETHPNDKNFCASEVAKSISYPKAVAEKTKEISYRTFVRKCKERALSTRVTNLCSSPALDSKISSSNGSVFDNEDLPGYFEEEILYMGHKNAVNCVGLLNNEVITAGHDYNLHFWQRVGKFQPNSSGVFPKIRHQAHCGRINALETFDQRFIVSAGRDTKLKIWSRDHELRLAASLSSQEQNTNTVAVATSGYLLSAGSAGIIKLWDLSSNSLLKTYTDHSKSIIKLVTISPFTAVSGSFDGNANLIDFRATRSIYSFPHRGAVTAVISWDDKSFYTAADRLCKWDLRSSKVVSEYNCDDIIDLEKAKGRLVSAGKFLTVWDDGVPVMITAKASRVKTIKYCAENQAIYAGYGDSSFIVFYIKAFKF